MTPFWAAVAVAFLVAVVTRAALGFYKPMPRAVPVADADTTVMFPAAMPQWRPQYTPACFDDTAIDGIPVIRDGAR